MDNYELVPNYPLTTRANLNPYFSYLPLYLNPLLLPVTLNSLQFLKNSIKIQEIVYWQYEQFLTNLMPTIYIHIHLFGRLICCALATKRLMYLPAFYDCDF